MKKRVFSKPAEVDWEEEILRALRNVEPGDYGNLDKHGNFFRLRYLTTVPVPLAVINKLVGENKIKLTNQNIGNSYYSVVYGSF